MTTLQTIPVHFDQEAHTYTNTETGEMYRGITGTLIHRLNPDKYAGIPAATLQAAANKGSVIHSQLELIETLGVDPVTEEGIHYVQERDKMGLQFLASEHTVSDLQHYATNIDVIYEAGENEVDLGDYKTTQTFDADSTSWQLSIGSYLLRMNNPTLKVKKLYGIWIREGKVKFNELTPHSDEEVKQLIEADLADREYTAGNKAQVIAPKYAKEKMKKLEFILTRISELEQERDNIKAELLQSMTDNDERSIDTGTLLITRVAPVTRITFDTKKFKEEHEKMYNRYIKESETRETLKLTLRN